MSKIVESKFEKVCTVTFPKYTGTTHFFDLVVTDGEVNSNNIPKIVNSYSNMLEDIAKLIPNGKYSIAIIEHISTDEINKSELYDTPRATLFNSYFASNLDGAIKMWEGKYDTSTLTNNIDKIVKDNVPLKHHDYYKKEELIFQNKHLLFSSLTIPSDMAFQYITIMPFDQ